MGPVADTIAALATPVGTSAIAVVRVSGPVCGIIATELMGRPPPPRMAQKRSGSFAQSVRTTSPAAVTTSIAATRFAPMPCLRASQERPPPSV